MPIQGPTPAECILQLATHAEQNPQLSLGEVLAPSLVMHLALDARLGREEILQAVGSVYDALEPMLGALKAKVAEVHLAGKEVSAEELATLGEAVYEEHQRKQSGQ